MRVPGPVLIIGASHQGEVVLDVLRRLDPAPEVLGFVDCGASGRFVGAVIQGVTVLGTLDDLPSHAASIAGAIPAVGDGVEREGIDAALHRARIPMLSVFHPHAAVSASAQVGPGCFVGPCAVVGTSARIGRAAIVNSGAVVDHHARVGDYAHVAPRACLAGGVRIGERAWVGAGATVLEDIAVGPEAVIGAGAVVTRDVPAATTVVGVPAAPILRDHPEKDFA